LTQAQYRISTALETQPAVPKIVFFGLSGGSPDGYSPDSLTSPALLVNGDEVIE
jgi:hypothetical protein